MNKILNPTSKHQVTIPKQVWDDLAMQENDRLQLSKQDGRYILDKAPNVLSIKELQAMNQCYMQERGIKPATDAQLRRGRELFYEQGGVW